MSTMLKTVIAGLALDAALGIASSWAADGSAIRPVDEAMTCEQIATELSVYAQQIVPNIQALGATQQQLYAQTRQRGEQRKVEEAMLTPLAEAGALDPTGASKRAYRL